MKKGVKKSTVRQLRDLLKIVSRGKSTWESTFDAIRDPVMIVASDFTIVRANRETARRAGCDIRKLVGKRCFEAFAFRKDPCPHCPLKETLQSRQPRSVEINDLKPGSDFQVNSYPLFPSKAPIEKNRTRAPTAVHHYRDVTEERRLQRKLIQSEKMAAIGVLASGVAHEINNPLAGILAFAQLLQKDLPPEGETQADLKEIEVAAKRCKRIVEDLLLFARPGEGEMTPLSVPETAERILPLARLDLRHRDVFLETEYQADLPTVRGSGTRLQQVFLNLIHNAAQSMSGGGHVTLRVRTSEDREKVLLEVIDQGCGIRKEDLPRLFDPFFTTKGRGEGTGLGLSICWSIISEHGGRIEVESEEGRGSLFRVVLPAQNP